METKEKEAKTNKRNFGNTLKTIAIVFCVIGVIASLVASNETVLVSTYTMRTEEEFSMALAFYNLMITTVVTILLYGFGELLDNVILQKQLLESYINDKD